ncbi:unnamed protein product [marine sediment metagenome]|uniref:Uncharacterized protein n=1 Tax=marine sediment metagenome TaxID=412755 RepID=X0RX14_9ZZZZ
MYSNRENKMKNTKLRIKKRIRISQIRKFKQAMKNIVKDNLLDIEPYIVNDMIKYLKKKGIIYYAKKNQKKH